MSKLPHDFYRDNDVVAVSRDLLGKVLCSRNGDGLTSAVITETEAYAGVGDRASHAYGERRTARTAPMYEQGGIAYVYLCYGIHHLFNVVVGEAEVPLAVLVRAGKPLAGIDIIRSRRARPTPAKLDLVGPGVLSRALGITTALTGADLQGEDVWIEDHGIAVPQDEIVTGPRVGIDYAGDDVHRPYRFRIAAASLEASAGGHDRTQSSA